MSTLSIGRDHRTKKDVRIPYDAFRTHFHLIGGTGKGKTTALHTMLQSLWLDPFEQASFFVIDRLGNFSQELLLWMASEFCPEFIRERLVFVQPSREDVVATFNPLLYESSAHAYYRIERSTEIVLRAWESQEVAQMPRLARWTYNAFMAAARLNLTISDCCHFLHPGSEYHSRLLELLGGVDPRLMTEWQEIMATRGQEAMRILDSSRNRLRPYFDSDILRRMFGSSTSRLDVLRLMREGRIVIVDLSPRNRLGEQLANTIGALLINEIIAQVRSLPRDVLYPTYLFLDEFQNFVGRDIESALPELRNLGLRLILSHQSFSQLERGDYDLKSIIFQAQSRMIFGVQGEDADILAHEVASLNFDAYKVKQEIYSRRQLNAGHRLDELESWSDSQQSSNQWSDSHSENSSRSDTKSGNMYSRHPWGNQAASHSNGTGQSATRGGGNSFGSSHTTHQQLVPVYKEFLELASRSYQSFDEQKSEWARDIRRLGTGRALLRLVNDGRLRLVDVKRSTPGFLQYDMHTIAREFPWALEAMDQLLEKNFESDYFVSAASIDREADERIRRVVQSSATIKGSTTGDQGPASSEDPII